MTKSGKHCGKRRNCTFCAISSFVTMFSNSHLLQRRQKASIWGKGFKRLTALIGQVHEKPISLKKAGHLYSFISKQEIVLVQYVGNKGHRSCPLIISTLAIAWKTIIIMMMMMIMIMIIVTIFMVKISSITTRTITEDDKYPQNSTLTYTIT